MIKRFNKVFLMLGMILLSLTLTSCIEREKLELEEGVYIRNYIGHSAPGYVDFYGELEIHEISEEEFTKAKGLNVLEVEDRYYSVSLFIIYPNTEERIYLDFQDLKTEVIRKVTFNKYYFCNEIGMIYPQGNRMNVQYKTDTIDIGSQFVKKDN